jgi:type VI secretion system Hcp family effector
MNSRIFWKFNAPDVTGSSLAKGHEGEIEVTAFDHAWDQGSETSMSKAAGIGAHHGTFNMTMELDESFTATLKLLWSGKHIEKGTLTCYRVADDGSTPMGVPYLKIEFEAIVITHMAIAGGGSGQPNVNVSVSYDKVGYTFQAPPDAKGTLGAAVPVSHDLRTNVVA